MIEAADHAEAYLKAQVQKFVGKCSEMQEGVTHPNWRTAEVLVKTCNEYMDQLTYGKAADYHFYIHFVDGDYVVNITPPQEVEE